jgi:Ca2+-binding EF-hand superfamily protein
VKGAMSLFNTKAKDAASAFRAADADGDGHLSLDELVAAAGRVRGQKSRKEP